MDLVQCDPKPVNDVNPFFTYILGFLLAIIVYQLDWSFLFPPLSFSLVFFLIVTFVISGGIGLFVNKRGILKFYRYNNTLNVFLIVSLITLGFVMEFAYSHRIPFISILNNEDIDYFEFGIPTFHVALFTFTCFFAVYLFKCYLVEKHKKYLFLSLYLLIFPVLVFNRGALLTTLSSMFFVYLFSVKGSHLKIYFGILAIVFSVLMAFGVLGNIRTSNQIDKNQTQEISEIMLNLGEAKPEFIKSAVPKEYFWSYLYIASPLANLQMNVDKQKVDYSVAIALQYVNAELNFDFVSKRIASIFGTVKPENKLIAPYLNVGTVYSTSYSYLGWWGMGITFVFLMLVSLLYLIIVKSGNPYFSTGLAILNTFLLFCIFDNMFFFSGLSLQLAYPILFYIKFRKSNPNNE